MKLLKITSPSQIFEAILYRCSIKFISINDKLFRRFLLRYYYLFVPRSFILSIKDELNFVRLYAGNYYSYNHKNFFAARIWRLLNKHNLIRYHNNELLINKYVSRLMVNTNFDSHCDRAFSPGVVLALVHTGDHYISIMKLAQVLAQKKLNMLILVGSQGVDLKNAFSALSKRLGLTIDVAEPKLSGIHLLIKRIKNPSFKVVFFLDAPLLAPENRMSVSNGGRLFGKNANIASGVLDISYKFKMDIALYYGQWSISCDLLKFYALIEYGADRDEYFYKINKLCEDIIVRHADIWLYLPVISSYYHNASPISLT